jgi:hypothetical protein|eukprot:TRINITY_DN45646_c0_g1_i1.p1 TRINITY_DN45646_c0_g1~~TRINITY_DN45646_c0_g1_i1.p1  ORF type:complete len:313 (+),score=18.49 TRINITY_DN45646_c0_g1_i1:60-941(+)
MAQGASSIAVRNTEDWCIGATVSRLLAPLCLAACPHRARYSNALEEKHRQDEEAPPLDSVPSWRRQHLSEVALNGERLTVRDSVFTSAQLDELLANARASPYFGENNGENAFYRGTFGFHVKFRDTHLTMVGEHLPFLKPALDALLRPECNCFFLNLFHARPDGQGYHTDNYFSDYCGGYRPTDIVTVAYVAASEEMVGGDLVVLDATPDQVTVPPRRGEEEASAPVLRKIQPRAGRVVDFDGRLLHAVNPFTSKEPRVSLVIEQCKLVRRHFLKTPKFKIYCQRTNTDLDIA